MSRTFKDKPSKFKYEPWDKDRVKLFSDEDTLWSHYYVYQKTTKTKKKKEVDTEWHWMSTPSWWTKMCMLKPQRRAGRVWERKVLFEEVEETDPPGVSNKPHIYYY